MCNTIKDIMTLNEASKIWNIDASSIRHAIRYDRFDLSEVRKSENVWLVMRNAMERLYGSPPNIAYDLFTIGYQGLTIERFITKLIQDKIATIVDVRTNPISRKKGFSKKALSEILLDHNINYIHYKELGSPKELRNELYNEYDYTVFFNKYENYVNTQANSLNDLKSNIQQNSKNNYCLLCFERDFNTCHRSILANVLSTKFDKNLNIIHLNV